MICVTNNRILIVYKNRELVNDIYTLYPDDTLNIITARSSIEALSKISFQLPNLIISEYDLENENGIDFCVKIRSSIKTKLIPFIIISDHDDHSENIRALQNGADAFLVRPFNDEELRAHIDNKISHYNDFYQLSIRDELTNLYNRREFINQFQYITSKDPSMVVSVAMVDIDFFKHVNDIHGHQVGDFVLMKFAETLQKFSYQSIIPTRFGGEEFAILLPGRDVQEAYEIIESIRKDFLSISFTGAKGNTFHVSFSTGIASYPDFADNISDILSLADQALYSAKKDGRGRTYIYKKHMSYNDRFWEYFEQTSNFYVDAHNNDAVTGLPFLPKLLEFLTTMSENINSIGVLTVNIEPLEGIRKYYGSHIYEIIIQNIKSVIEKVCYREYASETYFSISSFLEFGFTILFPSLFDFTLNSRKCHQLFMDITRQVDNELTIYPVEITSSDGVIYYANNN
ncbi:MAG: diguanylate cyclase, partial [Spirochaetota bacterium]